MPSPKAFISYSWTSPEHQQWVIDLATQLRDNGVDVILDKWDLKEGHDSVAFMEKMVTDPTVQKVIIVSDHAYAEKADGRHGGVGTETQIISAKIYAQADQNKFVAVLPEVDADGKAYLPTYYASRIYIDLSSEEIYPENFEQLVRWIFGKPAFPKPPVGKPPSYLEEGAVVLPTKSRASRALDLIQKGSAQSEAALRDYLEVLADSFESLRIDTKADPYDDAVVNSIEGFLPYRDEFVHVITVLARHDPNDGSITLIKRFFESILRYCYPPENMSSYMLHWWDNYKFILHELFLYAVGLLLKYERFGVLNHLVTGGFYVGHIRDYSNDPIQGMAVVCYSLESFRIRNQRLSLRRASLDADILKQRAKIAGITFDDLMQADFVLFMREAADALKAEKHNRWIPDTLVYVANRSRPFEVFARSQSVRYFDQLKEVLNVKGKTELVEVIGAFGSKLYRPQWNYHTLATAEPTGLDKLATIP